jgi:poly-beta-1,6-N-acetyl-D-glucosamine biosynthesis protein PgaD
MTGADRKGANGKSADTKGADKKGADKKGADKPWPPLIVAEHIPPVVKWRDVLLTAIIWICFLLLLDKELSLFLGNLLALLGFRHHGPEADWPMFFKRLAPFLLIAAVLSTVLFIFGLRTLRHRRLGLLQPQPAPLATAVEARAAGLDEAALLAWRDRLIVVVHIDADGRYRIEAPQARPSPASGA